MVFILAAIYLAKRSMRNKQQHGLEEFESVSKKNSLQLVVFERARAPRHLFLGKGHPVRKM